MEKRDHSTKRLRQRKFFMMLPLLILPFITLMFWSLGGGRSDDVSAQTATQAGINLKLPDAKFKDDKHLDKLSFYQQAALDSAKTKEAEKLDPYWSQSYHQFDDSVMGNEGFSLEHSEKSAINEYGLEENRMKVYSKLDELNKALTSSQSSNHYQQSRSRQITQPNSSQNETERLEAMMQRIKEDTSEDPETSQLNTMLDKIIAIQNADKSGDNSRGTTKNKSLSVKTNKQEASISLLKQDTIKAIPNDTVNSTTASNGFYGVINLNSGNDSTTNSAFEAIVPETQTLVAGAILKLVLRNDIIVNNTRFPSGTQIYGTTALSNERLKISITSIRFQNLILPVSLDVYDMDGQQGIYIPGSISRAVAKESADNAVSNIGNGSIDPTVAAQAASAGIEVAKRLFTKKIKLIRLTIGAGYKVLLKDNHENNF